MKKIESIGVLPSPRTVNNIDFYIREIRRIFHELKSNVSVEPATKNPDSFDLIMVLGGDGTMLGAARLFAPLDKPIVGVNFGEIGFLCAIPGISPENRIYFEKLINGEFRMENRMMVKGGVFRKNEKTGEKKLVFSGIALSDIVIKATDNKAVTKMITIGYSISGNAEEEISGDGMMVATPTGSTGYSLSCAGPIVAPEMECLIVNAIAPHTLRFRPIIAGKSSAVKLAVKRTKGEEIIFAADMQNFFSLEIDDEVIVVKSYMKANLIFFSDDSFFQAVKTKLK